MMVLFNQNMKKVKYFKGKNLKLKIGLLRYPQDVDVPVVAAISGWEFPVEPDIKGESLSFEVNA